MPLGTWGRVGDRGRHRRGLGGGDGGEVDAGEAGLGATSNLDAVATAPTPEIHNDGANVHGQCCNEVVDCRPRQIAGRLSSGGSPSASPTMRLHARDSMMFEYHLSKYSASTLAPDQASHTTARTSDGPIGATAIRRSPRYQNAHTEPRHSHRSIAHITAYSCICNYMREPCAPIHQTSPGGPRSAALSAR